MTQVSAKLKYIKASTKKLRPLVNALRGKGIDQAQWIIDNSRSGHAQEFTHTLTNATAMLKDKSGAVDKAKIVTIYLDEGPRLKRFRPVARGRSTTYQHNQSHLTLTLSDETKEKPTKKDKDNDRDEATVINVDNPKKTTVSAIKNKDIPRVTIKKDK